MSSRFTPPIVRARLSGPRLAVPGVIGIIEAQDARYALTGVDAGWPLFQPMDEWKDDVLLVEKRALTLEDRAVLERTLPDVELAQALALNADMESYELPPPHSEEELRSLKLASAARLLVVSETEQRALQAQRVPVYRVGYHRGSDVLSVELMAGQESVHIQVSAFEVSRTPLPHPLPSGLSTRQFRALFTARWIDRTLRALTQGVITEGAVQFARYCAHGPSRFTLLGDAKAEAAIAAAVQMSASADAVELPLHGRARRTPLPSFAPKVSFQPPPNKPDSKPLDLLVEIPAEDCWLLPDG